MANLDELLYQLKNTKDQGPSSPRPVSPANLPIAQKPQVPRPTPPRIPPPPIPRVPPAVRPLKTQTPEEAKIRQEPQARSQESSDAVNKGYKTSIRTMSDDISDIKKGHVPSGIETKKQIFVQDNVIKKESSQKELKQEFAKDVEKLKAELGEAEKNRIMDSEYKSFKLSNLDDGENEQAKKARKSILERFFGEVHIGKLSLSGRDMIIIAAVTIGLLTYGIFLAVKSGSNIPVSTLTPVPSFTSTYTPVPTKAVLLSDIFRGNNVSSVAIAVDPLNLVESFKVRVDNLEDRIDQLESTEFRIITANEDIELSDLVILPLNINDALNGDSLTLVYKQSVIFGQDGQVISDATTEKRIVFINEINNMVSLLEGISLWESDMPADFEGVYSLNLAERVGTVFMSNTYNGVPVRYTNFSYPDKSIDYAIVLAANGNNYLVISNSRESMFATVEQLRGF
jgi:hypothetical protein